MLLSIVTKKRKAKKRDNLSKGIIVLMKHRSQKIKDVEHLLLTSIS